MKSVVKHDAGFTGHSWLCNSFGCSVNEVPESEKVRVQVNTFLTTQEAWCAQHDQIFISGGTGIEVVASRVLCLSIGAILQRGPFPLTSGHAHTGSWNET